MRVIDLVRYVLLNQSANRVRFEKPTLQSPIRQQSFAQQRLHRATEPGSDRHPETHLTPLEILLWHEPLQHALQ